MAPLRQLNRAPVGGHPAAAVGGTAARLPAVIPWEPLATGGVLSISSPARAGASEARKPCGCEGSAGRLAHGAGSRESRGQCGRGEHGKPAARGPPRPPPRPATCVGAVATRLLRGPSPACKTWTLVQAVVRNGPAPRFGSGRPSGSRETSWRTARSPSPVLAVPRPPLLALPGALAPGSSRGSVLLILASSPNAAARFPRSPAREL